MDEELGMPLDSQDEGIVLGLDAFDETVFGRRISNEPFAEFFYGLMVSGVDLQAAATHDLFESGAFMDGYGMSTDFS